MTKTQEQYAEEILKSDPDRKDVLDDRYYPFPELLYKDRLLSAYIGNLEIDYALNEMEHSLSPPPDELLDQMKEAIKRMDALIEYCSQHWPEPDMAGGIKK